MVKSTDSKWLLLIHQIPPKPPYFRVKVWRRLQHVGAVAIKPSVYVLPKSDQAYEDLTWILKEITEGGGDASLCEASFQEGITDNQVKAMFQVARNEDYKQIVQEAKSLAETTSKSNVDSGKSISKLRAQLSRLKRRLDSVVILDFFNASGRGAAEGVIANVESQIMGLHHEAPVSIESVQNVLGHTWVTRKGVYVDRIACAWLIKRFVDKKAKFQFVSSKEYRPKKGELRFDMFQAEFTHEGDRCTFEVMMERFRLADHALVSIGQIIHDIDLKDEKFGRPEVSGMSSLFLGIAMAHGRDEERLVRGSVILDELYEYFSRQSKGKRV
jgi:hypothetical protein